MGALIRHGRGRVIGAAYVSRSALSGGNVAWPGRSWPAAAGPPHAD